jgi:hypothetical protein
MKAKNGIRKGKILVPHGGKDVSVSLMDCNAM